MRENTPRSRLSALIVNRNHRCAASQALPYLVLSFWPSKHRHPSWAPMSCYAAALPTRWTPKGTGIAPLPSPAIKSSPSAVKQMFLSSRSKRRASSSSMGVSFFPGSSTHTFIRWTPCHYSTERCFHRDGAPKGPGSHNWLFGARKESRPRGARSRPLSQRPICHTQHRG